MILTNRHYHYQPLTYPHPEGLSCDRRLDSVLRDYIFQMLCGNLEDILFNVLVTHTYIYLHKIVNMNQSSHVRVNSDVSVNIHDSNCTLCIATATYN